MDRLFDLSLAERRSWWLIWQLPVLVLTLALDAALALGAADLLRTPGVLIGTGLVVAVSVLALRLPARLLALAPALDIVAISFIRSETADQIVGINTSALVPIVCLGFCFGRLGLAGAVAGGLLVGSASYLRDCAWPGTGPEWIALLALPTIAAALGSIGLASSSLVRRQREALRRNAAIRQAVIDSVGVAVVFFEPDGSLGFANRRSVEAATRAEVPTAGPPYGVPRMWRADGLQAMAYDEQPLAHALRGEEFEPELVWIGRPDGRVASLVSARRVVADDGESLGMVLVSDDVTELVEAVRVREEFLATLSHELRTPLNGMIGFLDLLVEDLGSDPAHGNAIRTVRESAMRLSERIGNLLMASSMGQLVLERTPVRVADVVGAELARQAPHAENRGIVLEARLDSVVASLDPHLFGLVVQHLLTNALKHTPPGGTTRVELRGGDVVELVVSDTGTGMHGYERERAFDPFYRAASARRDAVPGVGLGLTIVRTVVEAHGGSVSLDPGRPAGTRVVVRVPAGPLAPGTQAGAAQS